MIKRVRGSVSFADDLCQKVLALALPVYENIKNDIWTARWDRLVRI